MSALVIIVVVLVLAVACGLLVMARLVEHCAPNELLIFSGGSRQEGGKKVGYRVVANAGRGLRIPLLERVDRMDLTNMIIDIRVKGAYAKGGIPLNVEGVANLKIASGEPARGHAIERFLGKPRDVIIRVARETLEGNLRGVLATLTPEEVNQDRVKFAQELLTEAVKDLDSLGLKLDTLKIQNVSDDRGYLDSLGRKQSADLVMRSRIAEAENRAMAAERAAENLLTQETARIEAAMAVARADAEKRIVDAQTGKDAMVAEERSQVTAGIARAEADVGVQTARLEQVRLKLFADRIKPAEAQRGQMIEQARGRAARIVEEGKATASALRELTEMWQSSGDSGRQILLAQKLGPLVSQITDTISNLPVDKVTVIDKALHAGEGSMATKAAVTNEQLKQLLGVDVPALLDRLGTRPSSES